VPPGQHFEHDVGLLASLTPSVTKNRYFIGDDVEVPRPGWDVLLISVRTSSSLVH